MQQILYIAALIWLAPVQAPTALYVSPSGNDAWSGTLSRPNSTATDGPFATIHRALKAARQARSRDPSSPITITILPGTYYLASPIILEPADSGRPGAPLEIRALPGSRPVLCAARPIKNFRPFRGQIWVADIAESKIPLRRYHMLFYRGRLMTLARFPNADPAHPRTGGFLYTDGRWAKPREGLCFAPGDIPQSLARADLSQAEVFAVYFRGWNSAITPITSIDFSRRVIHFRQVRLPFLDFNRYFLQNSLAFLDAPGEWFLDYKSGRLYFWPPDGRNPSGKAMLPVLDAAIEIRGSIPYPHGWLNVKHQGPRDRYKPTPEEQTIPNAPVQHITIRGLEIAFSRYDGIRITGARNIRIIACRVHHVGNVAINLGGVYPGYRELANPLESWPPPGFFGGVAGAGQDLFFNSPCFDCSIIGCDVFKSGSDGIFIYGHNNLAENNHVYDTGLFNKDTAAINLFGHANTARRNTLHDVPRNAIFIKGTDNIAELNDIRFTMLETCDGGAIRMCQRNKAIGGNIIRHNRILDTIGYGYPAGHPRFRSPYFSWAVYLDDYTCGTTVQGNIIARTGRGGVMLHGGSYNTVRGNLIASAGRYLIEIAPIRPPMASNIIESNVLICPPPTMPYRATRWPGKPATFRRNLVWASGRQPVIDLGRGGGRFTSWDKWLAAGLDSESVLADPLLRDLASARLSSRSPAFRLGFRPIPADKIGCYPSPDRATWPLRNDCLTPREKPLLAARKPRPLQETFEEDLPGHPPRHGDLLSYPRAPILVSAARAASGRQSLMLRDAPKLPYTWAPRIYYTLAPTSNPVAFSCSIWLDPENPASLAFDFRDYTTAQERYFSGPSFTISPAPLPDRPSAGPAKSAAILSCGQQLASVPLGQWFQISLTIPLGPQSTGASLAIVSIPGRQPLRLRLPHLHADFRRLDRLVIFCPADRPGTAFIDDLVCR